MMDHVKAEVVRDAENGRGGALTASAPQQAVSRPGRQTPRARRWVIAGVALAAAGGGRDVGDLGAAKRSR